MASLILVRNVVGELQRKRTLAASRGFLAAARLSCFSQSTSAYSALGSLAIMLYTNLRFTYLQYLLTVLYSGTAETYRVG